jgi:hypothetical protein
LPFAFKNAFPFICARRRDGVVVMHHTYAECWREPRGNLELFVIIPVLEISDEHVIIAWRPG